MAEAVFALANMTDGASIAGKKDKSYNKYVKYSFKHVNWTKIDISNFLETILHFDILTVTWMF